MTQINEVIKQAAQKVEAINAEFGYTASKWEMAADVWHNHMDSMQRFEVSKLVTGKGINDCYDYIEAII